MSNRRRPLLQYFVTAAAMMLTGCGSTTPMSNSKTTEATNVSITTADVTTTVDGPSLPGSDTPAVQLRVQAMHPVTPPSLPAGWTTVYADGTVLLPFRGDAAVQPQVWPYEVGHIDPARVVTLMAEAQASGLLAQPNAAPAIPVDVADALRTTVILTTANGRFVHAVDGLGLGSGSDATVAYLVALASFAGSTATLVMDSTAKPAGDATWPNFYEPVALDVSVLDVTLGPPGPGTSQIVDWTVDSIDLSTLTTCTTITDREAVSFLVGQMAGPKFRQHDHLYRIASRVHPPGTACEA